MVRVLAAIVVSAVTFVARASADPAGGTPMRSAFVPARADGASASDGIDDDDPAFTLPDSIARLPAPPVRDVLAHAFATAGLEHDPARGWNRRARLGGLVPLVSVRTGRDTSWQDQNAAIHNGTTFEVRATWRLDRLVFDGRELQVATIEGARRRERRRLANRVIRAYFTWRRAAAAAVTEARWSVRAEEAGAELDALTDGWFTDQADALRRGASEKRTP